jgi:hypothetical protein
LFYSHSSLGGSQFDLWSLDGVHDCFVFIASVLGHDAARQRQGVNVKDDQNMSSSDDWKKLDDSSPAALVST